MTPQQSKLRQQAEIAFRKLRAPALAKDRPEEKGHAAVEAHNEKTARLRTARLAKELADRKSSTSALIAKRAAKLSTTRSAD